MKLHMCTPLQSKLRKKAMWLLYCMVMATTMSGVLGGGRLVEPPMRSSLWRLGYTNVSANRADDFVNCGGFDYQWGKASGSCGACGDPLYGPSDHIYPGKYATNIQVRHINQGEVMNITVFADMNQLGYFQFNFCPQSEITGAVNLGACFSNHPLIIWETNSTKYYMGSSGGFFHLHLQLPPHLHCQSCVLQWVYVTGYKTGRDQATYRECLGCGPQETYINCADFSIDRLQPHQPSYRPYAIPALQTPTNPFVAADNHGTLPGTMAINNQGTLPGTMAINATATSSDNIPEPLVSPANSPLPRANALNKENTTSGSGGAGSSTNTSSPEVGTTFNAMKIDIYEEVCSPTSSSLTCEPTDVAAWCLKKCRQDNRCPAPACRCGCILKDGKKYSIGPDPISIVIRSPITLPGQNGTLCFKPTPERALVTGMPNWCNQNCPGDRCFDFCSAQKC